MEIVDFKKELNVRHVELSKGVSSACRGLALAILGAVLSVSSEPTSNLNKVTVLLLILFSVFDIIQYLLQLEHVRKYVDKVRGMDMKTFVDNQMYESAYTDFLSDRSMGFGMFCAKIICLAVSLILIIVQMLFVKI